MVGEMAQEIINYDDEDIQVPYWLSIYSTHYGRAAMALNWRPLWMGKGAITGVVEEVRDLPLNGLITTSHVLSAGLGGNSG